MAAFIVSRQDIADPDLMKQCQRDVAAVVEPMAAGTTCAGPTSWRSPGTIPRTIVR